MEDWAQVRWNDARQVMELSTRDEAALPEPGTSPSGYFSELRTANRREEATQFLALALGRFEAIAWAAHILEMEANRVDVRGADRQALDHALRWVDEPNDTHRRAAMAAAEVAGSRSPERVLGLAVFVSGGSISLPDLPPVQPSPEMAGKMAGGAIVLAAHRGKAAQATLDHALDLGEKVAVQGLGALLGS